MSSFEKKFGKYAIHNLTLVLIICYAFGYLLRAVNPAFMNYLTLNPYAILHGQVWRIISWIIIPPDSSNIFFVLIMLFFYFSLGTALERTWGAYRYNMYMFAGLLFTVLGAFLMMGYSFLFDGGTIALNGANTYFAYYAQLFSTYYVNMSIFLAYAVTFPDMQVLLMFIIPIKVKWLGIIYAVMLLIEFVAAGSFALRFVMLASLLNFLVFWLQTRNVRRLSPKQVHRRNQFKRNVVHAKPNVYPGGARHRCAVCGRTEIDDPSLEFRFCSKCDGNYEYCQDHIFTHIHVKKNAGKDASGNVQINPDTIVDAPTSEE